jgi:hypothetical protein
MTNLYSTQEYLSLPNHCPVRTELGTQLVNAIQNVYHLRTDSEAAKPESDKQTALLDMLQKARQEQRIVQGALSDHIKEHGCEQSPQTIP